LRQFGNRFPASNPGHGVPKRTTELFVLAPVNTVGRTTEGKASANLLQLLNAIALSWVTQAFFFSQNEAMPLQGGNRASGRKLPLAEAFD
jgi:hypothetical protein